MSHRAPQRFAATLRQESTGGVLLLVATLLAIVLANSGASSWYFSVRDDHLGFRIGSLNLDMSVGHWAADGLLAVFFFIVGLELKKEFAVGELRDPGKSIVPMTAAVGGVALPALIFAAVAIGSGGEALSGWAVPTATDIAFAVAVLAVVGRNLPGALRTFLLTLAVVDDLIAITIIAVFYTSDLNFLYLALALIPLAAYAFIAYRGERLLHLKPGSAWLLLLPLGALTWAFFVGSGIHATIAGVLLGFCVPVKRSSRTPDSAHGGLTEVLEHRVRPLSAGLCVPVFAFFSAGVAIGGFRGFVESISSPAAIGIVVGLLAGKCLGITGATWLITRFRGVNVDPSIRWPDVFGVSLVAGIGFTVSLLIAELSFGGDTPLGDTAKVAILSASVLAALLGGSFLAVRSRHYACQPRRTPGNSCGQPGESGVNLPLS
ncbi:Na+/H+ antiporter NhaA [Kocuria sp. TGY1127_2]|uniref:Na+/H+ antiporter NhaA n=1 Tax=Kocuria sp. TGY1127_2 TaxID=2711328 RepID=UPI0015B9330A|nr:Na+/H+ antiporter NhaA [Kocuria sp. TGY1127_2]